MIGVSVGVGLSTAADTLFAQVYTLFILTEHVRASNKHILSQTYGFKNYKRVGIILQRGKHNDVSCIFHLNYYIHRALSSYSCTQHLSLSLSPLHSYIDTSSDSIPSYSALSDFRVFSVANTAKAMCSKVYLLLNHTIACTQTPPTTARDSGALCVLFSTVDCHMKRAIYFIIKKE